MSVLKPLHGAEPRLEENLESFYKQDYPAAYEILFAVDEVTDAALPIVERVRKRHPRVPTRVIVNGIPSWPNPPAFSFAAMSREAQYDTLVTSDSDVFVSPSYLREVVPPLVNREVGMVTCLYRGYNAGGFWSLMDAMGMSVEMTAGVLTANRMEGMKFGLGPTIAVRRDALDAIGGYASVGEYFSNDFIIGNKIAEKGYQVVLSRHVIDHVVPPMTFQRMWSRQVRWAMGTKYSRPKGHLGTGLIFAVPYGLLAFAAAAAIGRPAIGMALLLWSILNRILETLVIGWGVVRDPNCRSKPWLYPARDVLGFAVWVASYLTRKSNWRRGNFQLVPGGKIISRSETAA